MYTSVYLIPYNFNNYIIYILLIVGFSVFIFLVLLNCHTEICLGENRSREDLAEVVVHEKNILHKKDQVFPHSQESKELSLGNHSMHYVNSPAIDSIVPRINVAISDGRFCFRIFPFIPVTQFSLKIIYSSCEKVCSRLLNSF